MSIDYDHLATALEGNDYFELIHQVNLMTLIDIVEVGLLIGPYRLSELTYRQNSRFHLRAAFTSPIASIVDPLSLFTPLRSQGALLASQVLPELLAQAFGDRGPMGFGTGAPIVVGAQVTAAIAKVVAVRKTKQTIRLQRDATKTLPEPNSCPAPLSTADYAASAARLNVTVPAIKAVAKVESGGLSGFDADSRPKILFEAHHFGSLTKHRFDKTHPHLSCKTTTEAAVFYRWKQYPRLFEAMLLDPVAACMSASWGKFQVLGETHDGWPDAIGFATAMFESEANHLKAFEAFCTTKGIIGALRSHDWAKFARGYNGKKYAIHHYDTQMATAYASYGGL